MAQQPIIGTHIIAESNFVIGGPARDTLLVNLKGLMPSTREKQGRLSVYKSVIDLLTYLKNMRIDILKKYDTPIIRGSDIKGIEVNTNRDYLGSTDNTGISLESFNAAMDNGVEIKKQILIEDIKIINSILDIIINKPGRHDAVLRGSAAAVQLELNGNYERDHGILSTIISGKIGRENSDEYSDTLGYLLLREHSRQDMLELKLDRISSSLIDDALLFRSEDDTPKQVPIHLLVDRHIKAIEIVYPLFTQEQRQAIEGSIRVPEQNRQERRVEEVAERERRVEEARRIKESERAAAVEAERFAAAAAEAAEAIQAPAGAQAIQAPAAAAQAIQAPAAAAQAIQEAQAAAAQAIQEAQAAAARDVASIRASAAQAIQEAQAAAAQAAATEHREPMEVTTPSDTVSAQALQAERSARVRAESQARALQAQLTQTIIKVEERVKGVQAEAKKQVKTAQVAATQRVEAARVEAAQRVEAAEREAGAAAAAERVARLRTQDIRSPPEIRAADAERQLASAREVLAAAAAREARSAAALARAESQLKEARSQGSQSALIARAQQAEEALSYAKSVELELEKSESDASKAVEALQAIQSAYSNSNFEELNKIMKFVRGNYSSQYPRPYPVFTSNQLPAEDDEL
jgi:hypothetical protein